MGNPRPGAERARDLVARARAAERQRYRRRRIVVGTAAAGVAVVVAAGVLVAVVLGGGRGAASAAGISGVRTFTGLARTHVSGPVSYAQDPPVGGPHDPVVLNCGIYAAPVPSTNAVHSLEHGAVWVTYRPGLAATALGDLRDLVRTEPARTRAYVILSPYAGLPAPVVASAWGKQLRLAGPADPRLARFIATYAQGPQTPEPGAPCSGGTGTPLR